MMTLVLILMGMAAVALLWVMPTLLRRRARSATTPGGSFNLMILKDEFAELEHDLANGTLSQEQYGKAREDLERRALEEGAEPGQVAASSAGHERSIALALALVIPICAAALYFQLGSPDAVTLSGRGSGVAGEHEIQAMVSQLAGRLEKTPDDANGWALLGRSYMAMQRYQDAAVAYARAAALIKDDAALLADYADALAMSQGSSMAGKPLELVAQALKLDPTHWKALALAGSAAFDRKDYKAAIGYWEKLRARPELNPEFARSLAGNIAEAQQLAGIKPGTVPKTAAPAQVSAQASVAGTVALSPGLAARADPADTVFIYARAAKGPGMPLAILRKQVKDLPVAFDFDDTQAMRPDMKLSNFAEIVVAARVSKSANAAPQSGDLQGASGTVKLGARGLKILIDSTVP